MLRVSIYTAIIINGEERTRKVGFRAMLGFRAALSRRDHKTSVATSVPL